MKTLRTPMRSLGLGAMVAAGSMFACTAALAVQGNGNSEASGGNPHVAGTTGNPHAAGTTGNPHTPGAKGNPHQGSPPYGVVSGNAHAHNGGGAAGPSGVGSGDPPTHSNNGHPGKTTICHSTGSAKNPFVEITIADPAVAAHARHHDGDDIIPAPAGGCDTAGLSAGSSANGTGVPRSAAAGGVLGADRRSAAGRSAAGDALADAVAADA